MSFLVSLNVMISIFRPYDTVMSVNDSRDTLKIYEWVELVISDYLTA